jgi:hypothetical protein
MTVDIGNRAVLDEEEGEGQLTIDKSKTGDTRKKAEAVATE